MEIPTGKAGTRETLKIMASLIKDGKTHPEIRTCAAKLTRYFRQKDWMAEIKAIHSFVRDRIRYVRDINGVETVHPAAQVLLQGYGDCDDKAILTASLLESIGHPTRLVAIGFNGANYSHVFVETKVGDKWLAVETTEPVDLGWRPQGIKNMMILHMRGIR